MIPLKLELKNFLSYGSKLQKIEFGLYPFICLSGKNGHGKSALLDAMTWAIWGQARKTSGTIKPDAQLLRLGQTTLLVIFDFAFNGQNYRIRREFTLTKKGNTYASLEFGILDPLAETVRPLTEKTIRDTQYAIEKMLGLDFDSFVNSAFLRQGQANEFSKKSPKDRKEILASILQLNKYEIIRKAALEKTKIATIEINSLKQLQERIQSELAHEEKFLQEQEIISKELDFILQEEKKTHFQLKQLEQEKNNFTKEQQQHQFLMYQINQIILEKNEKEKQLLASFKTWHSVCQKQSKLCDQKKLDDEKQNITKEINFFSEQQQKNLDIKEMYLREREKAQSLFSALKEQYLEELHTKQIHFERLIGEQQHKTSSAKDLEQHKNVMNVDCQEFHKELEKIIANLSSDQQIIILSALEKQFEKRKYYYQKWMAQANILNTELKNLKQKNELIDDQNPSCPLCEQNLSSSRKRFLKNNFLKIEHTLLHRIARFSHILKKLKDILLKQHKELEFAKKNRDEQKILQIHHEELLKKIATKKINLNELNQSIQKTAKELENLQALIKQEKNILELEQLGLDKKIELNLTYQTYKTTCNDLETQLKELQYDAQAHKKAIEQLQAIQTKEKELIIYAQELSEQNQRKVTMKQLIDNLRELKKNLQKCKELIKIHADNNHKKSLLIQQEELLIAANEEFRSKKEKFLEKKGSLQQQLNILKKFQEEYEHDKQKIIDLTNIVEDYQTIAVALSKDGIQALLIEDALPEIEQEANILLAQLTNNQAHIIIESLRDLKKGGTKETLDIKISDPMGIRPYELFSGGEAFRIDFALRIAISKLLARRAGTSLQTLIIDEGFGSQDEEGLGHLMDALIKIQHDFAKIIIVSHLPAVKDQFPVHFLIHKGPQGSIVNVIEH